VDDLAEANAPFEFWVVGHTDVARVGVIELVEGRPHLGGPLVGIGEDVMREPAEKQFGAVKLCMHTLKVVHATSLTGVEIGALRLGRGR